MATFESMIKKLEDLVKQMEDGSIPLEKAIELYEKGTVLAKECNKKLDEAEQKIKIAQETSENDDE